MPLLSGLESIYLNHFQKHGESSIPFLVNGKLSSFVLLSAYRRLPPIEEMPEREKKEMKQFVIDLFPDKNEEELVKAAKCIYVIGTLL